MTESVTPPDPPLVDPETGETAPLSPPRPCSHTGVSPNMKLALEKGWIVRHAGGYFVVVPHHREELDRAFPGDSIYARSTMPAPSLEPDDAA